MRDRVMKEILVNIALKVILLLDYMMPKKENKIIFYSSPDYSDNCRAMFETLSKEKVFKKYNITWVVKDVEKYKPIINNAKVVRHKSFSSLIAFLRSKYIIRTHSFWGNVYVPKRQVMCVAWHGMQFKGYHYSEIGIYPRNSHDFFCVTSPLYQDLFSEMFNADVDRFNITGFPRNDYLFEDSSVLKIILGLSKYNKIILWMPTFRTYANGVDGRASDYGLPTIHEGDLKELNIALAKHNYCLILKLHPWALDLLGKIEFSNIMEIKNEDIPEPYNLYHLISQADAMISDYSSVWGDYLLLDRPIAFAFDDLDEYMKQRKVPFSPMEDYMPGMKTRNASELIQFIDSLENKDSYIEERRKIRNLFHTYHDNKSSYRFLKAIGLLKKEFFDE